MRLSNDQFKRLKVLQKKKSLAPEEKKELSELLELKNQKDKDEKPWGNDFSWWNKYDKLMKDATNIAMNWIPGTGFNGKIAENSLIEAAGCIAINVANVYGSEDEITGPVNVQARNLWLAMHRKYRGLNTYQAADLGAVCIAGIEVIATITEVERVYGVINYYSINNRNLPYTLLAAMGVSTTLANNIRANLADFRYGLNVLLMRAQNILVPKDMSVVANKVSLYGYIYSDHKSARAQNYVFRSIATAKFEATLTGGSAVVFDRTKTISKCSTYNDVLDLVAAPIAALVEDDDVNKIYSDLLAYLGNDAFVQITLLPEAYVTVPVYDESILHKIHNAKSLGPVFYNTGEAAAVQNPVNAPVPSLFSHQNISTGVLPLTSWAITQKDNVLCTKVAVGTMSDNGTRVFSGDNCFFEMDEHYFVPAIERSVEDTLLDTYLNEMDDEHICEGVLFKTAFENKGSASKKGYVSRSCSFELICSFEGYINRRGNVTAIPVLQYTIASGYMPDTYHIIALRWFEQSLMVLSQFDWAPITYKIVDDDIDNFFFDDAALSDTATAISGVVFGMDVDNCRFVGFNEIYRIHETTILSGLYTTAAATEAKFSN